MTELRTVSLLDVYPDLAAGIPDDELPAMREGAVAPVVAAHGLGPWRPPEGLDPRGHQGLLIVVGLLARRVSVGHRTCAELLGAGDVMRPWLRTGRTHSALAEVGWTVVEPLELAELDRSFALRTARWPEVGTQLGDRILMRARCLAFTLAVSQLVRIEDRVLLMLWHLADRWGRGVPGGMLLPLPLTHRLLASIVGARRPSVNTAVAHLTERGLVRRRGDGSWLLRGDPPETIEALHRNLGYEVDAAAAHD